MKIVDSAISAPEKIGIYGPPGSGKTGLVTSLPWGEKWGEQAIYMPIDFKEQSLKGVLPHNQSRLIKALPEMKQVGNKQTLDLYDEIVQVLTAPWQQTHPEAKTIILDTISGAADGILRACAQSSQYAQNPIRWNIGKPGEITMAGQGDYGATHDLCKNIIRFIERCPLNVIAVFHADWFEPKEGGAIYGGPETVGSGIAKFIAKKLDNLWYVEQRTPRAVAGQAPSTKITYTVYTQQQGIWMAKTNLRKNPMPAVILEEDPVHFWKQYDNAGVLETVRS